MAQVNVAYDDGLLRHLDALAGKRGLSRPDLLRAVAEEAVRADEQGLTMFAPPPAPEKPVSSEQTMQLVHELREMSMGLDRLMRSAEKREKQLLAACNATEEANRTAREQYGQELAERFRNGTTPYIAMLKEQSADIARKLDEVMAAVGQPDPQALTRSDFGELQKEMKTLIGQMRPTMHLHFGKDLQMNAWGLVLTGLIGLAALTFLQTGLAWVMPYSWVATPVSMRLYGSADVGICELYKASRGLEDCPKHAPVKRRGTR